MVWDAVSTRSGGAVGWSAGEACETSCLPHQTVTPRAHDISIYYYTKSKAEGSLCTFPRSRVSPLEA